MNSPPGYIPNDWNTVALENRGLAECIVVLQEYIHTSDNTKEIEVVLKRLSDRFDWTIYTLKSMIKPENAEAVIDPNDELANKEAEDKIKEEKAREYYDKLMAPLREKQLEEEKKKMEDEKKAL